jgi:hypothetical protein
MGIGWQILWVVCGVVTIIAAVLASRSRPAMHVGRAAVGALFLIGGALLHVINLATGVDYSGFADPAHFGWVTHALAGRRRAAPGVVHRPAGGVRGDRWSAGDQRWAQNPVRLSGLDRVLPQNQVAVTA